MAVGSLDSLAMGSWHGFLPVEQVLSPMGAVGHRPPPQIQVPRCHLSENLAVLAAALVAVTADRNTDIAPSDRMSASPLGEAFRSDQLDLKNDSF